MKCNQLFVLIFHLLFVSSLSAQSLEFSLDSIVNTKTSGFVITNIVTEKDNLGRTIQSNRLVGPDRELSHYSKYEYYPDGQPKVMERYTCFLNGDTCILGGRSEFTEDGQTEIYYSHVANAGPNPDSLELDFSIQTWDTTFFDADLMPVKKNSYSSKDDSLKQLSEVTEFIRNNGVLDSAIVYDQTNGGIIAEQTNYEYDSQNRLISQTLFDRFDNQTYTTFEYDALDRVVFRKDTTNGQVYFHSFWEFSPDDKWVYWKEIGYFEDGHEVHYLADRTYYLEDAIIDSVAYYSRNGADEPENFYRWNKYYYSKIASNTNELSNDFGVTVFPNPSSDFIYLSKEKFDNTPNYYRIYNALGEVVKSGVVNNFESVNISQFPPGNYFLRLNSGETKLFVIQR